MERTQYFIETKHTQGQGLTIAIHLRARHSNCAE